MEGNVRYSASFQPIQWTLSMKNSKKAMVLVEGR
jgi:hypothetical protein